MKLSYEELLELIEFTTLGDRYSMPSDCMVKAAKLIIERCPERTLDVCRIMANKDLTPSAAAWFSEARQGYYAQQAS